ncbi:MAG: apolipoprotein N-acyltransferase [Gammaproteobacteria bacterium]
MSASELRLTQWLSGRRGDVAALMAGAPLALGFAPFGWYPLPVLCLAGLLAACHGCSPRRALWRGFAFGVASFLGGLYWIYVSVHVFGGAPLLLALVLMFALVLFMAVYPALFAYALARVFRPGVAQLVLGAPALWVLTEWLRGWLFSGFGWLSLGYSQTDGPVQGVLPIAGVHGASFVVVLLAGTLLALLVYRRRALIAAIASLVLLVGSGFASTVAWTSVQGEPFRVALIQGSVPQEVKWHPDSLRPTIDLYLRLTAEHPDVDLALWPEAAIPAARDRLDAVFEVLADMGQRTDTDYLVGQVEVNRERDERLNTVFSITTKAAANSRYVKHHLVPFGEYFPVPNFVRRIIQWMDLPFQDFTPGPLGQSPLDVAGQTVAVSICYEDVFGAQLRASIESSTVLANVSNDAWFGASLAPHQHLQIARVRALEAGRMILRSTNNGISAVIDADGRVIARSGQFEPEVLVARAVGRKGLTPFARFGNGPVITLACAVLVMLGGLVALRRTDKV